MKTIVEQITALELPRPMVLATVGSPGIGKTTAIKEIRKDFPTPVGVVETDLLRYLLYITKPENLHLASEVNPRKIPYTKELNDETWTRTFMCIGELLLSRELVVADATHLSQHRIKTVEEYRRVGAASVVGLVFQPPPIEELIARDRARDPEGRGFVNPDDIKKMVDFGNANPLTTENPHPFDAVVFVPPQLSELV